MFLLTFFIITVTVIFIPFTYVHDQIFVFWLVLNIFISKRIHLFKMFYCIKRGICWTVSHVRCLFIIIIIIIIIAHNVAGQKIKTQYIKLSHSMFQYFIFHSELMKKDACFLNRVYQSYMFLIHFFFRAVYTIFCSSPAFTEFAQFFFVCNFTEHSIT